SSALGVRCFDRGALARRTDRAAASGGFACLTNSCAVLKLGRLARLLHVWGGCRGNRTTGFWVNLRAAPGPADSARSQDGTQLCSLPLRSGTLRFSLDFGITTG